MSIVFCPREALLLWFFINVNRGQCWVEVSALTETQILNVSLDLRVGLRGPVVPKTNIYFFGEQAIVSLSNLHRLLHSFMMFLIKRLIKLILICSGSVVCKVIYNSVRLAGLDQRMHWQL